MERFVFEDVFKEELHRRDALLEKFRAGTCSKDEDLWDYCFSEFCAGGCARYRKIAERRKGCLSILRNGSGNGCWTGILRMVPCWTCPRLQKLVRDVVGKGV